MEGYSLLLLCAAFCSAQLDLDTPDTTIAQLDLNTPDTTIAQLDWDTPDTTIVSSVPDIVPYQGGFNSDVANVVTNLLSNTYTEAQHCRKALLINSECQKALIANVWTLSDPNMCMLGPEKRYCLHDKNENCVTGPGGSRAFLGMFIAFCTPLPTECSDCATLNYAEAKPMIDLGGTGAVGNLLGGNIQTNLGTLVNPNSLQPFFDLFRLTGKRKK